MSRTERILVRVGVAAVAVVLVTYAARRLVERTAETLAGGVGAWPLLALLAVPAAFTLGQYHRGYMHARGIRRSHWQAIRGGHR